MSAVDPMDAPALFTPSAKSGADLDALTVGSTALADSLASRIVVAASEGARPHTLLVGPTGAGKTHTLHVAVRRALSDPASERTVLPVVIPENVVGIGRYADLLVEVSRAIGGELVREAQRCRLRGDSVGIESLIARVAQGRMILLVIENLDRVFAGLGSDGQGSFRAWVETSASVTVFASAPTLFEGVSSRKYPWYGSFIVEPLAPLAVDDIVTLLQRSARRRGKRDLAQALASARGRRAVEQVYGQVGGWPRAWQLLSGLVGAADLLEVEPAVELLLDRLVDHYRPRLWALPAGEQRMVVELARGKGPRTVSDLAAAVEISNQSAATALGRLTARRWVSSSKAGADRRESWYDLTDPLLRAFVKYREQGYAKCPD